MIVGNACSNDGIREKMDLVKANLQQGNQPYSMHLEFSYGIVNYEGDSDADEESLIQLADQRMYAVKDTKNQKK